MGKLHEFGNSIPYDGSQESLMYIASILSDAAYVIANYIKPKIDIDIKLRYGHAENEEVSSSSISWSFEIEEEKIKPLHKPTKR